MEITVKRDAITTPDNRYRTHFCPAATTSAYLLPVVTITIMNIVDRGETRRSRVVIWTLIVNLGQARSYIFLGGIRLDYNATQNTIS